MRAVGLEERLVTSMSDRIDVSEIKAIYPVFIETIDPEDNYDTMTL